MYWQSVQDHTFSLVNTICTFTTTFHACTHDRTLLIYSLSSDDFDAYYIEEDLTREELPKIASRLNPSKSCRLSCILLKKTHVWDDVCQSHPYAESQERILRVLEKWFENVPSSPQNRRTLASACESVDQGRLASCIAKKAYYDET